MMKIEKIKYIDVLKKFDFWKAYVSRKLSDDMYQLEVEKHKPELIALGFTQEQIETIKQIAHPQLCETPISAELFILFLKDIDDYLFSNKYPELELILIGGTAMSFFLSTRVSVDVDMVLPVGLNSVYDVERFKFILGKTSFAYLFSIDIFSSGDFPSASIKNYYSRCVTAQQLNKTCNCKIYVPKFKKLIVRFLDPIDLFCAKIFTARKKDILDCISLRSLFSLSKDVVFARMLEIDSRKARDSWYKFRFDAVFKD